jgi:hypothetical protein
MCGRGRGAERRHRAHAVEPLGDGHRRRAAERVPDQQLGRRIVFRQVACRIFQVVEIAGETGVRELAFALAQSGEVEAQHGEAVGGRVGE